MSHLNVFDDKVPFIVRDNLWNYCINSTYRLGWEDTDVPEKYDLNIHSHWSCLLYTSPSPRDRPLSRMPSSA